MCVCGFVDARACGTHVKYCDSKLGVDYDFVHMGIDKSMGIWSSVSRATRAVHFVVQRYHICIRGENTHAKQHETSRTMLFLDVCVVDYVFNIDFI